jgi:hypothetical protein
MTKILSSKVNGVNKTPPFRLPPTGKFNELIKAGVGKSVSFLGG